MGFNETTQVMPGGSNLKLARPFPVEGGGGGPQRTGPSRLVRVTQNGSCA